MCFCVCVSVNLCVYVCVYVCVYICVYVCVYLCVCVYIFVRSTMYMYVCVCMCVSCVGCVKVLNSTYVDVRVWDNIIVMTFWYTCTCRCWNLQLPCPKHPQTPAFSVFQTAFDDKSWQIETLSVNNHQKVFCQSLPVVANGILLFSDVHELSGNTTFLLTLSHQPLH